MVCQCHSFSSNIINNFEMGFLYKSIFHNGDFALTTEVSNDISAIIVLFSRQDMKEVLVILPLVLMEW